MTLPMIHTCSRAPKLPPYIVPLNKEHALGRSMVEQFCTSDNLKKKNHRTHLHIAVIVIRGKIAAIARNSVGSRSKGVGFSQYTIHAEPAVLKELGDLTMLRDATMYVFRLSRGNCEDDSDLARFSEPCSSCIKLIEKCHAKYGLRKVYYSL